MFAEIRSSVKSARGPQKSRSSVTLRLPSPRHCCARLQSDGWNRRAVTTVRISKVFDCDFHDARCRHFAPAGSTKSCPDAPGLEAKKGGEAIPIASEQAERDVDRRWILVSNEDSTSWASLQTIPFSMFSPQRATVRSCACTFQRPHRSAGFIGKYGVTSASESCLHS